MRGMTQRDLARQLGISHDTVQRALSGYGDVAAPTITRVRTAAAAAGMTLPPLRERSQHTTRRPRTMPTARIVVDGKHLGRFTFDGTDWQPSTAGTHDGYVYRLGFYCIEREGADDGPAE